MNANVRVLKELVIWLGGLIEHDDDKVFRHPLLS